MSRESGLRELTDEGLLARACTRSSGEDARAAASELLGRYSGRVYAWCYRMVGNRERALELAQEVLLSAWNGLESFAGRSAFGSWLFVVARNRCLSELRRPPLLQDEETEPDALASEEPAQDLRFEREQDQERLLGLVRRCLDRTEQEAIWLRCYEGMPVDEITRVLKVSEASGARAVLQRARRKLRAAMQTGLAGSGGIA